MRRDVEMKPVRKRLGRVRCLGAGLCALVLLGSTGCGSSGEDTAKTQALERRIADLERELTEVEQTTATSAGTTTSSTTTTAATTTTEPPRHQITGTVEVGPGTGWIVKNDNCASGGFSGYSDLRVGTTVVVKDSTGTVVATGSVHSAEWANIRNGDVADCILHFAVDNIPASDFYTVEVSHRGGATTSRRDLEAQGWHLTLVV